MPLKGRYNSKEEIPANLQEYYEANSDGIYYLQAEGMVQKTVVDEFRTNNIALQKSLDKFKDIDPDEYSKLKNRSEEDFKKAVTEATTRLSQEQIDTAVSTRVKTMATEHAETLKTAETRLKNMESMLSVAMIDNSVRAEAIKSGVHDTAVDDVVLRARSTFRLVDGSQVVAFDAKGEKIFDKDGQTPMPVGSWVKDLKKTAPHLFKGMDGGGAGGGRPGGGANTANMSAIQKIEAGLAR